MQDPVAVKVFCSRDELQHESFDLGGKERFRHIFLKRLEVVLEEVHDEEYTGLEDQHSEFASYFGGEHKLTHSGCLP